MTTWDTIYKNYQQGGEAWATLQEGLLPQFLTFVKGNTFEKQKALDIGCGTGKYLLFLQHLGFQVLGIDSSATAVEMTQKALGDTSTALCANMFTYDIPKHTYDFIFSISTIHHGLKAEVAHLIDSIYRSLAPGGKVFITLPDIEKHKHWRTFKTEKEIAPGTYVPQTGPEKGLAHSVFSEQEIRQIFIEFNDVNLSLDEIGRWCITGSK
jgi:SAM-dependent methyltransferase